MNFDASLYICTKYEMQHHESIVETQRSGLCYMPWDTEAPYFASHLFKGGFHSHSSMHIHWIHINLSTHMI